MQRPQSCHGCCKFRTGTIIVGLCGTLIALVARIISDKNGVANVEDKSERKINENFISYTYLNAFFNILLIYGALKGSKYCLVPWLAIVAFILSILTIEGFVYVLTQFVWILYFAFLVELWYIWFCVLSYFNELNQPRTTITTVGGYPALTQSTAITSVITYESEQPPSYADIGKYPVRV